MTKLSANERRVLLSQLLAIVPAVQSKAVAVYRGAAATGFE